MSIFSNFLKKFRQNEEKPKPKALPSVIVQGVDPSTIWKNIAELGDGAFGKVYKSTNIKTGRVAALKSVDFTSNEELVDLVVEIEILNDCKHPNILGLHEAYIFEKKIWMYLEFCAGGAVDSIMKALDKPLSEPQIKFISHEVISGLAFLHEHFIIHRDLKAGNILITANNEIRLADFGVSAKMADETQKRTTFIGTPYWMAPEVIACETFKDNPYNMSADVWSFGITLIEFAQMLPPYNDLNPTRVMLKITKAEPPALDKPSAWSSEFNKIVRRCLQKNPGERPTMAQLKNDPFIANVTENDRVVIKILLGEVNAEVEETVENIKPDDLSTHGNEAAEGKKVKPDLDVAMVSAEAAQVMAHSLQAIDEDSDEKVSGDGDEEMDDDGDGDHVMLEEGDAAGVAQSYEDIKFDPEDANRLSGSASFAFDPCSESLSVNERAVREVADSLLKDLLLGDVDCTSLLFMAFECIKDHQDLRFDCIDCEKENVCVETSFRAEGVAGAASTTGAGAAKDSSTASIATPMRLPDFAMEISAQAEHGDEDEAETKQLTTHPTPLQSQGSPAEGGDGGQNSLLPTVDQSPVPMASVLRKCPSQFRASIRTRRFVVDGQEHTTTSKRVVLAEKTVRPAENSLARMRALRDFRELAKESKRRNREIAERVEQQMRQLESKQATEFTQLHRCLSKELEAAAKKYKAGRDRLDAQYELDVRGIRESNAQSDKAFLEQFKQALDRRVASRTTRRAVLREVREAVLSLGGGAGALAKAPDVSPALQEAYAEAVEYLARRGTACANQLEQIKEVMRKQVAHLDLQLQTEQYELNMKFAKEQGKMEQRHMHMRHQLARSQLKDFAMADRQLLAKRLASQLVELREAADADREKLLESQVLDKKIFLKNERAGRKRRIAMFQKKLRDDGVLGGLAKEAITSMEETERARARDALLRLERHQGLQRRALDRELMARLLELDEQQAEKKTLLADQETARLRELDDEHRLELKAHSERLQRKLQQLRERYEKEVGGRADVTFFIRDSSSTTDGNRSSHSRKNPKRTLRGDSPKSERQSPERHDQPPCTQSFKC